VNTDNFTELMPVETLYIGELETPNFSWRFAGATIEQVRTLAETAWKKHREQTGARYTWATIEDSLYIWAAHAGQSLKL
jgi:hypothetical protein